jgi:histidinol-phosphate aminotransferase
MKETTMPHTLKPQPGLLNLKPYVGGEDIIPKGYECKVLLSSNENPLGASPDVVKAIQETAQNIHIYPSGTARKLKAGIAQHYGLAVDRILCTNGSEDGLTLLIRAFAGPGDEVLYSQYAFSLYGIVTRSIGAFPVIAPALNYNIDVDALLKCVTPKTRIVILDNPRNPIGMYIPAHEVRRLREGLPQDVLLVLDSAYGEYMTSADYSAGIDFVDQFDNVVMTRTFSKFYGLAGLRVGWMYAQEHIIDYVNRIRAPFCCNSLVQGAGCAALQDVAHQAAVKAHHEQMMPWFMDQLRGLGYSFVPSVTNFVLVEFPAEGACHADAAYLRLAQDGYIVRPVTGYGLPNHLRITVGLKEDMEQVVEILRSFLHDYMHECDIKQNA